MPRTLIVAELATAHHGDVGLAEAMLHAAAEAGADFVKTQHYRAEKINPSDPQAQWLRESALSVTDHRRLMSAAVQTNVRYMVTPFCVDSLMDVREAGVTNLKVASSESSGRWWKIRSNEWWCISLPWGRGNATYQRDNGESVGQPEFLTLLTAIPLYPTPLEAVGTASLLQGWSDHCEGTSAAMWAIAQGVKVLEVHVTYPGARQMSWDKSMDDLTRLRDFAEDCQTMSSGVARKFRERWTA